MSNLLANIRAKIVSSIAFPQLLRVDRCRLVREVGGYVIDGEVVVPGTLHLTGELLQHVPVCIGVGTHAGAGVYGKIQVNQLVVVQYLKGNKAHPIITGVYTHEYSPACDDVATVSVHGGDGTVRIANMVTSLREELERLIDTVCTLQTQGGPSNQVISPGSITELQALKGHIGKLLQGR